MSANGRRNASNNASIVVPPYKRPYKWLYDRTAGPISEIVRLFPDGFIIGSGLFALITLSAPYAAFFGAQIEALGILYIVRKIVNLLGILDSPEKASKDADPKCRSGFTNHTLGNLSMFGAASKSPFPSVSMYALAVACSYVFMTINAQVQELAELGPNYSSRFYLSLFGICAMLFAYFMLRLLKGCDSFWILFSSLVFGGIVGLLLVTQNQLLFGDGSINLMGIPMLKGRNASGAPLYLCPTQGQ